MIVYLCPGGMWNLSIRRFIPCARTGFSKHGTGPTIVFLVFSDRSFLWSET